MRTRRFFLKRRYKAKEELDYECLPPKYTLVIAEKPKAAEKIAIALSNKKPIKCRYKGIPFWIIDSNGGKFVVASSAGHLYGITTNTNGFPVFNYTWAPLHEIDKNASHLAKFYSLLDLLSRRAFFFINACDYDIEGSVIGYFIIKNLGDVKKSARAIFSTLTPRDIRRAFSKLRELDWEMIEAGIARHELDWLWGINVSRALMRAYETVTRRKLVLSAGRVQSPTLIELVKRDRERNLFLPLPVIKLMVTVELAGKRKTITLLSSNSREYVEKIAKIVKKTGYLEIHRVSREVKLLPPPPPFNLGDLQSEAGRIYKLSPIKAQEIAEKLYLEALISYPRTNSQRIPESIDVKSIVEGISKLSSYREYALKLLKRNMLKPRQGLKSDPAHPAIHPTGLVPKRELAPPYFKIYDLIVRRFLASMMPPAKMLEVEVLLRVPNSNITHRLVLRAIVEKEWLEVYNFFKIVDEEYTLPENSLEELLSSRRVRLVKAVVKIDYTSPPPAYTKTSIVKWMEDVGIGTEATRARIVETLFSRGYLSQEKGKIVVTDLGYAVAHVLQKYFNEITQVSLTREFEEKINAIRMGKTKRSLVVNEAKHILSKKLLEFKEKYLEEAGSYLNAALDKRSRKGGCRVCSGLVASQGLCEMHMLALKRIKEGYMLWRQRLGSISFNEYLRTILKLSQSGKWIKEVSKALILGELE